MGQWGLKRGLRELEPWDIPERWLDPGKIVTDPVHGEIYLTRLEQAIVDSTPFQRLRRIRQLATVHLVYPGATHTRFSHALGALRVVQDLLDIVLRQRQTQRSTDGPYDDLFSQWEDELAGNRTEVERRIAEVVVFGRLGALLHDFCHVAYGHSIEDELQLLDQHDQNLDRFNTFWKQLGDGNPTSEYKEVQQLLGQKDLKAALRAVILDKEHKLKGKSLKPPEDRLRDMRKYPFIADMVTNTICADLLDYLPRDHLATGLPIALGTRFMTQFYVTPARADGAGDLYPERMALRLVRRDGRERGDTSTELLKHLRYRYELQERVLVHHAKLAADAMLGKALELWHDQLWIEVAEKGGKAEFKRARERGVRDVSALRGPLAEDVGDTAAGKVDKETKRTVELVMRQVGDDGLLEMLACQKGGLWADEISTLGRDLLNRRLYKRVAQSNVPRSQQVFDLYGSRDKRRELEREAASYAEIPVEQVVIWVPDPKMRLKIAGVLVHHEKGVSPFYEYSKDGEEIYDAHKRLWAVTVFVHPEVRNNGADAVVARLAELMGLAWDAFVPAAATKPDDWPLALAAEQALDGKGNVGVSAKDLLRLHSEGEGVLRRSADRTYAADVEAMEKALKKARRASS